MEPLHIPQITPLVIHPLDPRKRRAHRVQGFIQTKLAQGAEPHGQEDEVGAGVDDDAGPALEHDEVDAGAFEGESGGEADGAATDDDGFES